MGLFLLCVESESEGSGKPPNALGFAKKNWLKGDMQQARDMKIFTKAWLRKNHNEKIT
jgi:hypothetical protein